MTGKISREPVENFAWTYVARRELLPVIKEQLLPQSGLTLEEADLLLELYGSWKLGWHFPPCDQAGYVTLKALEEALMNSQPHISRRVAQLLNKGLVEPQKSKGTGRSGRTRRIKLSQEGRTKISAIWRQYNALADRILQGVEEQLRLGHLVTCHQVCARIRPRAYLGQVVPTHAPAPVENLMMVFEMARDLREAIAEKVLVGTNLSIQRADILVILYLKPHFRGGLRANWTPLLFRLRCCGNLWSTGSRCPSSYFPGGWQIW
jgi:DNA-binding MarR family transcriptional regulator